MSPPPMMGPKGRPGNGAGVAGPMARMMPGVKAKNFKQTVSRLFEYMGPYKIALLMTVIFAVFSTMFEIFAPLVLGDATTLIFNGVVRDKTGVDFVAIGRIIMKLAAVYFACTFFSFLQSYLTAGISQKISYKLRYDIAKKIDRLPVSVFESTTHGEILSRITNDVDTVAQTLNQGIAQSITSVVTICGIIIVMFSINIWMSLVTLIILPVVLVFVRLIVKASSKFYRAQQKTLGQINGHVEEMYSGHNVVKAFNGEESSVKTFTEYSDILCKTAWKSQALSGLMMPMVNFVGNVGYVVICIMGGAFVLAGRLEVGNIQSFIQYMRHFTRPISEVSNIANVFQSTAAAAERVFEFLDSEEECEQTKTPASTKNITGTVTFEHVRFGYLKDKIVIKDFSCEVQSGMQVAIVGPTGSGKTTIVKLLMRYYDVNEGSIKIDGVDIRDFTRDDLRSQFAMVLQDTWLFNDTVMENIRYGKPDATDEEVIAAAKTACVDRFIHQLAGGYNMVINEEANNISQGQKQLITIARAVLANPPMLILDEATSSVDTRTESLIQTAMKNLMKDRTSFVIAHRLSTIRDADMILVVNDGDVIERGNHTELMAKNGFYAELYNSQFKK